MIRTFCALFLAGYLLFLPASRLDADEDQVNTEKLETKVEISSEDRKVIRRLELLEMMELLKDLELLEGRIKAAPEDEK